MMNQKGKKNILYTIISCVQYKLNNIEHPL